MVKKYHYFLYVLLKKDSDILRLHQKYNHNIIPEKE